MSIFLPNNASSKQVWGQLPGSSLSFILSEVILSRKGCTLIIAPDNLSANQLINELLFFLPKGKQKILLLPDWETLPYDQFSPHQDIISQRLSTLNYIRQKNKDIVIVSSVHTLLHRLCPSSFIDRHSLVMSKGQSLSYSSFSQNLIESGYRRVNKVLEHGEFSLRGSIIDLFPMGSAVPFRIELFNDSIDSLRSFDPETQRTITQLDDIHILPARECH